jgi:hypothetical protein
MAEAVATFNRFIRTRTPKCYTCGSTSSLTCGHLITAKKASTRFDEKNVRTQCSSCNYRHEYHPEVFTMKYIGEVGFQEYVDLVARSMEIKKHTPDELREIIKMYSRMMGAV